MKKYLDYVWPVIGLAAVGLSFWLLFKELKGISAGEVIDSLSALSLRHWLLAIGSTVLAYAALAWYDRIALLHLGVHHISWPFIAICSFTTYALSHNIGASVFSGAMVRYRAYGTMGLSIGQVGVLVALCSFTFILGTVLLGGLVLTIDPALLSRLSDMLPGVLANPTTARLIGLALLGFVALYVVGSVLHFKPMVFRSFHLEYPRPGVTARQLIAAPAELLGAAGIIYFALPEMGNPGFLVVLAVFLASFSAALASHAPGGLGVFEIIFLTAMPDIPKVQVLAALLVFRLLYLLVPLAFAAIVVVMFERARLARTLKERVVSHLPGRVGAKASAKIAGKVPGKIAGKPGGTPPRRSGDGSP